jgi:hypothetical protein
METDLTHLKEQLLLNLPWPSAAAAAAATAMTNALIHSTESQKAPPWNIKNVTCSSGSKNTASLTQQ